jgi:hypothetical protein
LPLATSIKYYVSGIDVNLQRRETVSSKIPIMDKKERNNATEF